MSSNASLSGARATLQACATLVSTALEHLARHAGDRGRIADDRIDTVQQPVHEIVWCATWLRVADAMLEHATAAGGGEIRWAKACVAEAADEIRTRLGRAPADFGLDAVALNATFASPEVDFFLETALDATTAMDLARSLDEPRGLGRAGLTDSQAAVRDTFRRFGEDLAAEPVRSDAGGAKDETSPALEIHAALRQRQGFGLAIPRRYGGWQDDSHLDPLIPLIAVEELARGGFGELGAFVATQNAFAVVLLQGGTEAQKAAWLPPIARGETVVALCAGTSHLGADAALPPTARRDDGWILDGLQAEDGAAAAAEWLLVLARTDPDAAPAKNGGLSFFITEKPAFRTLDFEQAQPGGGFLRGISSHAEGMPPYAVGFERWSVPEAQRIGGDRGLGRGLDLQCSVRASADLHRAATTCGTLQRLLELAWDRAHARTLFGRSVFDHGVTQWKLARMATLVQSARQFTYAIARRPEARRRHVEAAVARLFASRVAEWVAREARRIDAATGPRTTNAGESIHAGATSGLDAVDDILALRVLGRALLEEALERDAAKRGRALRSRAA